MFIFILYLVIIESFSDILARISLEKYWLNLIVIFYGLHTTYFLNLRDTFAWNGKLHLLTLSLWKEIKFDRTFIARNQVHSPEAAMYTSALQPNFILLLYSYTRALTSVS